MLYLYTGTDRKKALGALNTQIDRLVRKETHVIRISDANSIADLTAALAGGGMFGGDRIVVLNGTLSSPEMQMIVFNALGAMEKSLDTFFIIEEKTDATMRKQIEKYAKTSERFDAAAKKRDSSVFGMANALGKRDKRSLWLNYQGELAKGTAPEAIHGVLFWVAKDLFLKSRVGETQERAKKLLSVLAELPHEARRHAEELEYALERFVLSGA